MSKAKERALEFYPVKDYNKEPNYIHSCDSEMLDKVYREVFMLGYKMAEKDLGWHSVEESLPPIDEEVIVLRNESNGITLPYPYNLTYGHLVADKTIFVEYNDWNVPGVKYWMPMPKLPNEDE